ncbi:hypothetical protein RQP46_006462 [Phenoliferia psychrophenolica]
MSDGLAKTCNGVSLVYIIFITVMFCFPNFYPANMNYTSAIGAVFVFIGAFGWYASVRKNYAGPGKGFEV